MRKHMVLGALAAAAMGLAGTVVAAGIGFTGTATLVNAVASPTQKVVDGVTWDCEGNTCVGRAETRSTLNSFIKDCRKVAEAVGPLAGYTAKGRNATKGEINTCNRLAGK
jgi:hypothetical protein